MENRLQFHGQPEVSLNLPEFCVFQSIDSAALWALGWLGLKGVLGELPLSRSTTCAVLSGGSDCFLPEREIPLSSVWMHCFHTPQVLCCCVSHPMRARFQTRKPDELAGDWLPAVGVDGRKEGLQLTATDV